MWAVLFTTVFVISFSLLFATIAMDKEGWLLCGAWLPPNIPSHWNPHRRLVQIFRLRHRQETSNIPLAAKGATIMGILRIASLTAICAVALIDSAYAGAVSVPGPIAGAGIPGLIAGGIALLAWYRQRK
jgi:hypothetical protein